MPFAFSETLGSLSIWISNLGLLILITLSIAKHLSLRVENAIFLVVWHSLFSVIAYLYALDNPADSKSYFVNALSEQTSLGIGSDFVTWLGAKVLLVPGSSFFTLFAFFNIIGSVAVLLLYALLRNVSRPNSSPLSPLYLALLLLPGLSFWSSAPGKDAVALVAATLFVWSEHRLKWSAFQCFIAVTLMALVRPHVAAIMLVSVGLVTLFDSRISILLKLMILSVGMGLAVVSIDFLVAYVRIQDLTLQEVQRGLDALRSVESDGAGAINNDSTSVLVSMFGYLFFPLPGQILNILGLISSIENLFLLSIFIGSLFYGRVLDGVRNFPRSTIYFIITLLVLSYTTYNYGIALRQKWMILPAALAILIFSVSQQISVRSKGEN